MRFSQFLRGWRLQLGGSEVGFVAGLRLPGFRLSAPASASHPGYVQRQTPRGSARLVSDDEPYIGRGAPQWRYFVEFRARNAASYGHLYVMYGKVNDRHEIIKSEVAGFFPAGDDRNCVNCSVYNWTIGHVLPVPSEIGASDGDLEEQYVLARFRVWIDAAAVSKPDRVHQ